jgi:hypothetical protein
MRNKTLKKNRPTWPPKYYRGLSKKAQTQRRKEILKFGKLGWKNPKAYVGFKTDRGVKTRKSGYVATWNRLFPGVTSMSEKAKVTGVPEDLLRESYNRGMAAWRTGHRPGATEQQWGHARVDSLLLCGKTSKGPDADLFRKAQTRSRKAKSWYRKTCKKFKW